jgi:hypothetical protein
VVRETQLAEASDDPSCYELLAHTYVARFLGTPYYISFYFLFLFSIWLIDDRRSCSVAGQTRTAELHFLAPTWEHACDGSLRRDECVVHIYAHECTTFLFNFSQWLTGRTDGASYFMYCAPYFFSRMSVPYFSSAQPL